MRDRGITVGSRVELSRGYSAPPQWLESAGADSVDGRVRAFIGAGNDRTAVVELDKELRVVVAGSRLVTGRFLIAHPRFTRARWRSGVIVGIALSSDDPTELSPTEAAQAAEYIESHAMMRTVG